MEGWQWPFDSATCLFAIKLVIKLVRKENNRIVKDKDKWGLAKSLTTHHKIIFPFLKNAVCDQIIEMFKPKKIPVTLNSPFRKKDTKKRLSDIRKNILVIWLSNSSFKIRSHGTPPVVPIYMFLLHICQEKGAFLTEHKTTELSRT
jgi:hypothetical protein